MVLQIKKLIVVLSKRKFVVTKTMYICYFYLIIIWILCSFGLSDLHGDGRLHPRTNAESRRSGFGFELTFRLVRERDEMTPPTWPANMMQQLAKYVFKSQNTLMSGDHVSWHAALDGGNGRITQILMGHDPQFPSSVCTPHGDVRSSELIHVHGYTAIRIIRRFLGQSSIFLSGQMRLVVWLHSAEWEKKIEKKSEKQMRFGVLNVEHELIFRWCHSFTNRCHSFKLSALLPRSCKRLKTGTVRVSLIC